MPQRRLRIKRALLMAGVIVIASAAYFIHGKKDYSGIYKRSLGSCPDVYIDVKRVQGFGDKNYFIYIYREPGKKLEWELQGVLRDRVIAVNSATRRGDTLLDMSEDIGFDGAGLKIHINGMSCTYTRID